MRLEEAAEPVFARHETFHLRYGWLKNAHDGVAEYPDLFLREDAPMILGVGKNMVRAIKFWGLAAKILQAKRNPNSRNRPLTEITDLGRLIFGSDGLDPSLGKPQTLWLLHWLLFAPPCRLPAWWLVMNEFSAANVQTEEVVSHVQKQVAGASKWKKLPHPNSVKKDIDVFVHTYSPNRGRALMEDYLDCPFRRLHVLKQSTRDTMRFVHGRKRGMSPLIVTYACLDFAARAGMRGSVSAGSLAREPGGPGGAFKMGEADIAEMLEEAAQDGHVSVRSTAGMLTLSFEGSAEEAAERVLFAAYGRRPAKRRARAVQELACR